jgi:hypothetical protein
MIHRPDGKPMKIRNLIKYASFSTEIKIKGYPSSNEPVTLLDKDGTSLSYLQGIIITEQGIILCPCKKSYDSFNLTINHKEA